MKPILICVSFLILSCCQSMCGSSRQDMTPEEVVEAYLEISLNMTDPAQKAELLDLTTGVLHSSINAANDETITNAFVNKNYKLQSYSVMQRRDRTPRETEITFQIAYKDLGEDNKHTEQNAPEITTDNTVSVLKEKGIWRIHDVIGKKTTIDFPVAEEVIKPKPKKPEKPKEEGN